MTTLTVSQLSQNFGGLKALRDVSFGVRTGELLAIIGPNGAGKSTLINVIGGDLSPSEGMVVFGDRKISGLPPFRINAAGLVRTFQSSELYTQLSVIDNVVAGGVAKTRPGFIASLCGAPKIRRLQQSINAEAEAALELVGLAHRKDDIAATLPAGQQRLLAIARALVSGADWLMLDEPAAGLNSAEKLALTKVIRDLADRKKTIMFIEHDMRVVGELAERVLVLDRGELIADGPPSEIRRNERVVTAYLGGLTLVEGEKSVDRSVKQSSTVLLRADQVSVNYRGLKALDNTAIEVKNGELVAIIGANGAGKSSLLKAIMRTVPLAGGRMEFAGQDISAWSTRKVVQAGIALAPEGRGLFGSLTVSNNLRLGAFAHVHPVRQFLPDFLSSNTQDAALASQIDEIYELFPRLADRMDQLAGTLSGGEGQMLSIGRALMSRPKLLLLDEPSLGLAPRVTAEIFRKLIQLRAAGLTIVLVEQNARSALEICDRAYVLEMGRVAACGTGAELLSNSDVSAAYFGETTKDHALKA